MQDFLPQSFDLLKEVALCRGPASSLSPRFSPSLRGGAMQDFLRRSPVKFWMRIFGIFRISFGTNRCFVNVRFVETKTCIFKNPSVLR